MLVKWFCLHVETELLDEEWFLNPLFFPDLYRRKMSWSLLRVFFALLTKMPTTLPMKRTNETAFS